MARLNDYGLEIGKANYEVGICKHVGDDPNDYETIDFECASSYRDAVDKAKKISMMEEWNGIPIFEAHVVKYTATDYTDYEQIYIKAYRKGKFFDKF